MPTRRTSMLPWLPPFPVTKGGHDVSGEPRDWHGRWTTEGTIRTGDHAAGKDAAVVSHPVKAVLSTWDAGPDTDPDFHKKVPDLVAGMSKKELAAVAEYMMNAGRGWRKVKPTAEGIAKAVEDRWGSYLRASI